MSRCMRGIFLFVTLGLLFCGCRDSVIHAGRPSGNGADGGVPVSIVLGDGSGPSRTIAPAHVTQAELLGAGYTLHLTGTNGMGDSVDDRNFSFSNGVGGVHLTPGVWRLALEATPAGGAAATLRGTTEVQVLREPVVASLVLEPVSGGTGTVDVTFSLAPEVVGRLDPDTSTSKPVTVALYDDLNRVVAGTEQVTSLTYVATQTTPYTVSYNRTVASGRYTLRLESTYTVQNSSTKGQFVTYRYGWSDILYVEDSRESATTVTLTADSSMNLPKKPHRRTPKTPSGSSGTAGFTRNRSFNPWGDTLWLYGADFNGPGNGNDGDGNEWVVVSWDSVYDADHYEVELLVHPFTRTAQNPTTPGGKFPQIVTTDAEWDVLKESEFTYNTTNKSKPFHLRFSGGEDDPDYYRSRVYEITCLNSGNSNAVEKFLVCADKPTARSMFTAGGYSTGYVNSTYTIRSAARDCFDNYGNYTYDTMNLGKVGLEADCSVLPVLLPAFTPQMALVFRVRAVNRFGYSDWVYWKGGKW